MSRLAAWIGGTLGLLFLAGCVSRVDLPDNLSVGPSAPAQHRQSPSLDFAAPPQIVAIWLSTLTLQRGATWSGQITTSSNAASVEVRTDTFSFSVPRVKPGTFAFAYAIPDLPPFFRRHFVLHVVARNAAGDRTDEELPIDIE